MMEGLDSGRESPAPKHGQSEAPAGSAAPGRATAEGAAPLQRQASMTLELRTCKVCDRGVKRSYQESWTGYKPLDAIRRHSGVAC